MTDKLKPCPFCEQEAEIFNGAKDDNPGAWRVRCGQSDWMCWMAPDTMWLSEKEDVVAIWNTRPLEQVMREALVEIVKLGDVRADEAGHIASQAIKKVDTEQG